MTRIKRFDRKAILNRNRVLRYRIKRKLLSGKIENIQTDDFPPEQTDNENNISLREKLRVWASDHRITSRAINDLLAILLESGKHYLNYQTKHEANTFIQKYIFIVDLFPNIFIIRLF